MLLAQAVVVGQSEQWLAVVRVPDSGNTIINLQDSVVMPKFYSYISLNADGALAYENKMVDLLVFSKSGNLGSKLKYDVYPLQGESAGKWMYCTQIIDLSVEQQEYARAFYYIANFHCNRAYFARNFPQNSEKPFDRFGYLDRQLQPCIRDVYSYASLFHENKALVGQYHRYFFIDTTGRRLSKGYRFRKIYNLEPGTYCAQKGRRFAALDQDLAVISKYQKKAIISFSENMCVRTAWQTEMRIIEGYYGDQSHWVTPPLHDAELYIENTTTGNKFRVFGVINTEYSEGLCTIKVNDLVGAMDTSGKWIIEPQYEDLGSCANGLLPAKYNGRWGYINRRNEWIIEPKYSFAAHFVKVKVE